MPRTLEFGSWIFNQLASQEHLQGCGGISRHAECPEGLQVTIVLSEVLLVLYLLTFFSYLFPSFPQLLSFEWLEGQPVRHRLPGCRPWPRLRIVRSGPHEPCRTDQDIQGIYCTRWRGRSWHCCSQRQCLPH